MSEGAWFTLLGLAGALLLFAWVGGMLVVGAGLLRAGSRLIPRRSWRKVAARVDRVVVRSVGSGYHLHIHCTFTLHRPGLPPQPCAEWLIPNESFDSYADAERQAFVYQSPGTIDVWYAEECPSLQYLARPRTAWQATKGLMMIALGVLFAVTPVLIFWR